MTEPAFRWTTVTLSEIATIQFGYAFPAVSFAPLGTPGAEPLIRIRDVGAGRTETAIVGVEPTLAAEYTVHPGDILVGMDGIFHVREWSSSGLLNQRVARIAAVPDRADQTFLLYAIREPIKTIERSKHFTTVKHLSAGDLRGLRVNIPPLSEQHRIGQILSTIQRAGEARWRAANAVDLVFEAAQRSLLDQSATVEDT